MYNRINLNKARGGTLRPYRPYGFNRRAHQLRFQFKSPRDHERIHRALVSSSPGEKRNLIHRHKETWAIHLLGQPLRKCHTVARETFDKPRFENVQVLRPSKM